MKDPLDQIVFTHHDIEYAIDEDFAMYMESTMERMLEELDEDSEETPSGAPYCGCITCVAREALVVAVGMTIEGVVKGNIGLVGKDAERDQDH